MASPITPSTDSSSESSLTIHELDHQWGSPPIPVVPLNLTTLFPGNLFNSNAQFIGVPAPAYDMDPWGQARGATPPLPPLSPLGPASPFPQSPFPMATPPPPPPLPPTLNPESPTMMSAQMLAYMQQQTQLVHYLQQQVATLQQQQQQPTQPAPVINIPENTIFRMPAQPASDPKIEVAKPPIFSGKMAEVDGFIAACRLYLQLKMKRQDEQDKIYWVLSYMQTGYVQDWCENMIAKYEDFMDDAKPETVEELFQLIKHDFGDLDEVATKIGKLRTMTQGELTCEEHVQHFRKTARGTRYARHALIEEFKQSLNGDLQKKILEGVTRLITCLSVG